MRNISALVFLFLLPALPAFSQPNLAEPGTATYKIAKNLVIREIRFDRAGLSDAIAFFQKESTAADPEKNGLNFVLKKPDGEKIPEPTVTMSLRNIPLSEALKYVSAMTGYQVRFEEYAIVLAAPQPVKKDKP